MNNDRSSDRIYIKYGQSAHIVNPVEIFTKKDCENKITKDNKLIVVMSKHLKLNFKLDEYNMPQSDIYIKIPNMKIKTAFRHKTKIIECNLLNRRIIIVTVVLIMVEGVETTYLSTKKSDCFSNLF